MRRRLALAMALWLCWAMALSGSAEQLFPVEATPVEAVPSEVEAELPAPVEAAEPEAVCVSEVAEVAAEPEMTASPEAIGPAEVPAEPEATAASEPEPIALNAASVKLGVGETFALQLAAGENAVGMSYRSSNTKVARVSSKGVITGRKKGSAVVTLTTADGRSAACQVRVKAAPKAVSVNAAKVELGYDKKQKTGSRFALKAKLTAGSASAITYSGYSPKVVEVTEAGELIARGKGKTTVTVSTFNGKTALVKVTVLSAPGKIALDRTALTMFPGDKTVLKAVLPSNTAGTVRFESSDPAVATVDADTGAVRGVGLGSAVITAVSFNGKEAACAVAVEHTPKKISLEKTKVTLGVGERFALDPKPLRANGKSAGGVLTCTSARADVATVSDDGTVLAVKPGKAKITVKTSNGVRAACTVTVKAAPKSVSLAARLPKLWVGEDTTLKTTLTSGSASHGLTYSGYDESVLTVSGAGKVKATGVGVTKITVTTFNELTASCTVRVLAKGSRKTAVIAHRGGAGDWPENSLEAFRHAPATGADEVELDVRTAADGAQVVHHDATFAARGKKYTVEKLTLAELQALDGDICSLDEALEVIAATGLGLKLEMKDSADPKACVEAVAKHGMTNRVCYIAFDANKLMQVRAKNATARVGYLFTKKPGDLEKTIAALKPDVLAQRASNLTRDDLLAWQNRGFLVGVWTLNDADSLRDWVEAGADYVITDIPKQAVEIVDN